MQELGSWQVGGGGLFVVGLVVPRPVWKAGDTPKLSLQLLCGLPKTLPFAALCQETLTMAPPALEKSGEPPQNAPPPHLLLTDLSTVATRALVL